MTNNDITRFKVSEKDNMKRLDIFLSENMPELSRSYIQSLIKDKLALVNMKAEKVSCKLKENDTVSIEIPEPVALDTKAEDIPLEILYQDDDLAVVYKERGMVVHPAAGNYHSTLVNALMHHMQGNLSSINGVIRPGIVHRIDKDTSGLLMIAKSDRAHRSLSAQLKNHSIKRVYTLICYNALKEKNITIDRPIGRNPKNRLKMAIVPDGKRAVTHIEAISSQNGFSYAKATLETGRTHQIRVHMASIGHPLLGDTVYGPKNPKHKIEGQLLHAGTIGFIHPATGEYMEFHKEEPDIFQKMLLKLSLQIQ